MVFCYFPQPCTAFHAQLQPFSNVEFSLEPRPILAGFKMLSYVHASVTGALTDISANRQNTYAHIHSSLKPSLQFRKMETHRGGELEDGTTL